MSLTPEYAKDIIKKEEGYSAVPYLCSERYVTIGYGTKLHKDKDLDPRDFCFAVNQEQADIWLEQTIKLDILKLQSGPHADTFNGLNAARQAILVSMCYQMGIKGVYKFRNMWKELSMARYSLAAVEMLDSKWASQTSIRANRHSNQMRYGFMLDYYVK